MDKKDFFTEHNDVFIDNNLVYMAKPIYGGWVTCTAHMCLINKKRLVKIAKRTEPKQRDFGYGVGYQNMRIDDLLEVPNLMITAVDKHYWKYLHLFPERTKIIIHDPTELKGKENPLIPLLSNFEVITIRETVKTLLKEKYGVDSVFMKHPFYKYPKTNNPSDYFAVSIARIDFDKHTDLILQANKLIKDPKKRIYLFGAENRLYVHHKLQDLDFPTYWKGKYPKTLPLSYNNKDLLNDCKFVVDMSIIKEDGGGTQYTFLEAMYHDCNLILHKEWVEKGNIFVDKKNCYVVGYTDNVAQEIADIIQKPIGIE
jgi:hypothetical protein